MTEPIYSYEAKQKELGKKLCYRCFKKGTITPTIKNTIEYRDNRVEEVFICPKHG